MDRSILSYLQSRWSGAAGKLTGVFPVLVILTVCTNLRIGGFPLGAGEAGLVALMAGVFYWRRHQLAVVAAQFRPLLYFWGAYLAIVLVAGGLSLLRNRLSVGAAHDVLASTFSISVGFLALVLAHETPRAGSETGARLALVGVLVALLAFVLVVIDYLNGNAALSSALHANQWWWGRFNGWAQDPNQWGFMLMVACMLALLTLKGRLALLVFGVGLWLLLEVRSDAAIGGILAFGVTLLLLSLFRVPSVRRQTALVLALLMVLIGLFKTVGETHPPSLILRGLGPIVGVVPSPEMLRKRQEMATNPLYSGYGANKLDARLAIWRHSVEAWKVSPVIGLGPGAYSGITGPMQDFESHNLMLQILVNAGALGFLAAAGLLGWLLWRLWTSPEGVLWIALIVGVLVQGLAQYMMRHPLFWVVIALAISKAAEGRRVVRNQSPVA